ncbi:RES domain-containing protein [Kocuria rosea]|uniref:RES domain-containing protein n=1 Tax=Kocuria rosea TaxID=1275 RepID=UPI00140DDA0F|nr:RES domain-containing protein [Kocuria rosea]
MTLVIVDPPTEPVWRVGYRPEPLAWSGWEHATDGRFHSRWDDPHGTFRTLYLGESLLACLLEVLAFARKDKHLAAALAEIDEDPEDAQTHPTADPGSLDPAWLGPRCAASAVLSGRYCQVSAAETVATLYPRFIGDALDAGYDDFDAALLKTVPPGPSPRPSPPTCTSKKALTASSSPPATATS